MISGRIWHGLSGKNLKTITSPIRIFGIEEHSPDGQLIILTRALSKAVEGENIFCQGFVGRARLRNPQIASPAIDDFSQRGIRKAISKLAGLQVLDVSEGTKDSFCRNLMASVGVNTERAWRYLRDLDYYRIMPALRDLSSTQLEEITIQLRTAPDIVRKVLGEHQLQEFDRLSIYPSELAYDKAMVDYAFRPEDVPEHTKGYFEFGWHKMARVLRQFLPDLAGIENDVEFLVKVFSLS